MWLKIKKLEMSSYEKENYESSVLYENHKSPVHLQQRKKKNPVTSFVGNWHIYENAVNYVVVCFTVHVKILIYVPGKTNDRLVNP